MKRRIFIESAHYAPATVRLGKDARAHAKLGTAKQPGLLLLFPVPQAAEMLPTPSFRCYFRCDFREAFAGRRTKFRRAGEARFGLEVEIAAEKSKRAAVDGVDAGCRMAGKADQGLTRLLLGIGFKCSRPTKER